MQHMKEPEQILCLLTKMSTGFDLWGFFCLFCYLFTSKGVKSLSRDIQLVCNPTNSVQEYLCISQLLLYIFLYQAFCIFDQNICLNFLLFVLLISFQHLGGGDWKQTKTTSCICPAARLFSSSNYLLHYITLLHFCLKSSKQINLQVCYSVFSF